ncbi:hypothetical protein [Riemerella columbipharyngis]|uniref:Uncharacterized protein n=1 Tax=Riemerella columbipharyngis TaxID=1071918 RepID=A0A1G7E7T4_9FLAO|nr:hypothetical protein [Riemerella columbipharyngis]SDE59530.1 hypothetical protein SAMN05421544_11448 [Riemerella columbipharyngis]
MKTKYNMLKLFKRKVWYHFYLPAELYHYIKVINDKTLKQFFYDKRLLFRGIRCEKISNKLFYVSVSFNSRTEKETFEIEIAKYNELFPPWVVFPDIFYGAPRWNQGIQEDYCIRNWLPYWGSLDFNQKEEYLLKYDCPKEWIGWFKQNNILE